MDADTGNVVDAGNDRTPLPPASLTKVITALTASTLAPDTPITVSARAAAAPADKLLLKPGQVWTADELLHGLLISSANDAAISLAEQVGGSLEGFQPIFARTALGLGMADHPVLMDPAGLDGPDGVDGGNLVSARDLAMAGRALLAVPSLAAIVATPVYYFDGPDNVHHRLTNHNKLFLVDLWRRHRHEDRLHQAGRRLPHGRGPGRRAHHAGRRPQQRQPDGGGQAPPGQGFRHARRGRVHHRSAARGQPAGPGSLRRPPGCAAAQEHGSGSMPGAAPARSTLGEPLPGVGRHQGPGRRGRGGCCPRLWPSSSWCA